MTVLLPDPVGPDEGEEVDVGEVDFGLLPVCGEAVENEPDRAHVRSSPGYPAIAPVWRTGLSVPAVTGFLARK